MQLIYQFIQKNLNYREIKLRRNFLYSAGKECNACRKGHWPRPSVKEDQRLALAHSLLLTVKDERAEGDDSALAPGEPATRPTLAPASKLCPRRSPRDSPALITVRDKAAFQHILFCTFIYLSIGR